jgi:hypothetical protein
MQERHPIDDRFRQVLANAEAEPPASVWAGIAAAQDKRRRGGAWSWRRYAGLALVGTALLGAMVHYATNDTGNDQLTDGMVNGTMTQAEPGVNGMAREKKPSVGDEHTGAEQPGSENLENAAAVVDRTRIAPTTGSTARGVAKAEIGTKGTTDRSIHRNEGGRPTDTMDGHSVTAGELIHAAGSSGPEGAVELVLAEERTDREQMGLLSPVFRREIVLEPMRVDRPVNYVLPRGEWWLGAQWSTYSSRSTWKGSDEVLAAALDQSEGTVGTTAWGLLGGRQWRSGLGLSSGIIVDRLERTFSHVDAQSTTTEEISSYFVTLNDQVFVSNVDTIRTTTVDEELTEGIDRRTMVRIPVLGHWTVDLRRWTLGVRAGMALELTRAEAGPGLLRVENGMVGAGQLNTTVRSDRYPDMVLALAGIDLGYRLHERWSVQAGYAGMQGVAALSEQGPVQAYPVRHGAELRLIFHLPSHTRP